MTEEVDIEEWAYSGAQDQLPAANSYLIRLWDGDGFDEKRRLADPMPTGAQILEMFGRHPMNEYVLLLLDRDGLHEIGPSELIDIGDRRAERFFAFKSDRLWFGALNDRRFPWGQKEISEQMLRLIHRVPSGNQIILTRTNQPDCALRADDNVDLGAPGLERMFTRRSIWKLLVQGVPLTFNTPHVLVSDALIKAGLDPDQGWTAVLKLVGQAKEKVSLTDTIDLSRKGIEKLWLRPTQVNNGEVPMELHRAFEIREQDVAFLNAREMDWETVVDGAKRWFIIRNYELPSGYRQTLASIAVLIPSAYPAAELDMFYCAPHLQLESGRVIPCTQQMETIKGTSYQRWSRHRHAGTRWNPAKDSLITQIALIEDAIAAEVGEVD